jgi:hypothetical protein
MTIKKFTLLIAAMLCVISVEAQQSKTDASVEFRPHWDLQLQGGASYTVGESSKIGDLLSPALYLSTNYRFHHAMGVRFGLGGWQGRGFAVLADEGYAFNFLQLNADYKLDLCGVFGGYNHRRVVNPYLLAGVGFNYGFDNKQANAIVAGDAGEVTPGIVMAEDHMPGDSHHQHLQNVGGSGVQQHTHELQANHDGQHIMENAVEVC